MKNVLVTGATGLIGSNLCKTLTEKGYKVRAVVRESSNISYLETLNNIEFFKSDIKDFNKLKDAFENIDIVYHCAAQLDIMDTLDNEHAITNIQGTRNVMEACLENSVKKIVYISTVGVTGILKDHYNEKEDAPYIKTGNPYYDTKIDAERLVLSYYENNKLPVVIVRPGLVYGKNDRNILPAILPRLLKQQLFYVGSGNNDIALTSIDNLMQALLLVINKDGIEGEIFNITDDQGITLKEFIQSICKILEIKEPKIHIPTKLANNICKIINELNKIFDKSTIINEYTIALITNNYHFNISKAKNILNYNPEDNFEKNLRKAIYTYLDNNKNVLKEAENYNRVIKVSKYSIFAFLLLSIFLKLKNKKA